MKKNIKDVVAEVMEEYEFTKSNDNLLIALVHFKYNELVSVMNYFEVMEQASILGLPSSESITRARRKLQEENPLIYGATEEMKKRRKDEQFEFYFFSKDDA